MRSLLQFALFSVLALVVLAIAAIALAYGVAHARYHKHWAAHTAAFPIPFPATAADSAAAGRGGNPDSVALARAVARGAHLVQTRVGCHSCHGPDLGGGVIIDVPVVGYWAAPNITTGDGGVTRGFGPREWDLAVRHGVRHDGRTSSMPCDEFSNLSDHELSDIVAYVRSMPPVDKHVAHVRIGPVFAVLLATHPKMFAAYGIDHAAAHAVEPPLAAATPEFGRHIAQVCTGCHGPNLSGGKVDGDPNMPIVANLTPHASGLAGWTESDFVTALREGRRPDGSRISEAMPWSVYGHMDDVELHALWAYLRTVPARPKGGH